MEKLMNFLKDEEGAGMIEYALLAALIGVVLIAIISPMTTAIGETFTNVKDKLDTANQ